MYAEYLPDALLATDTAGRYAAYKTGLAGRLPHPRRGAPQGEPARAPRARPRHRMSLALVRPCLNCGVDAEMASKVFYCVRCATLPRCSRCKRRGHHLPTCHWSRPTRRPVPVHCGVLTAEDFARFYDERYGHAVGYASKFLRLVDAEDVVQGVFLYTWRRLDTLPDLRPTRLFAWIKYAARHEVASAWRRRIIPLGVLDDVEAYSVRHERDRSLEMASPSR